MPPPVAAANFTARGEADVVVITFLDLIDLPDGGAGLIGFGEPLSTKAAAAAAGWPPACLPGRADAGLLGDPCTVPWMALAWLFILP